MSDYNSSNNLISPTMADSNPTVTTTTPDDKKQKDTQQNQYTGISLFGPLPKNYCLWFYYLSVLGFIMMFLLAGSGIYMALTQKKGINIVSVVIGIIGYSIFYLQNRILYHMCINSTA